MSGKKIPPTPFLIIIVAYAIYSNNATRVIPSVTLNCVYKSLGDVTAWNIEKANAATRASKTTSIVLKKNFFYRFVSRHII